MNPFIIRPGLSSVCLGVVGLSTASSQPTVTGITETVTGTTVDGETLEGTFTVTRFVNQGGELVAVGTLTIGDIVDEVISWIVDSATGTCEILELVLGPLHLDLLGLVIDLNQLVLTIVAESGAGNLLGNLLCAVANLLNGSGPLGAIAGLLNNILRALG